MILSQTELRKAVDEGAISFDPPLEEEQWGEASIDLRLGRQITQFKDDVGNIAISLVGGPGGLGTTELWNTREYKSDDGFGQPETFKISKGQFVLALTYESIKVPRNLIARVEGRSTYARYGLSMHQTAPWIQPGWSGPIILELMHNGKIDITLTPAEDRPCQITFFELTSEVPEEYAYGAKKEDAYQDQKHPFNSRATSLSVL